MVCLVKEVHSAPVVSVQVWVGTGAIHEGEYMGAGLSHYLEHMLFKGTTNRAPGEVSKAIDNAGGDINAYTANDRTVYLTDLPASEWRIGVDVISDAVMNASFPEQEWLREREVVLREVAMGRDDPNRVLSKLLYRTAYRVHPYRHPVIGHDDILTKMNRDELITFYRRHYVPDNMIAIVVGDVQTAEVETALREVFEPFERRARAPVVIPEEPPQAAPRFGRQTGAFNLSRLTWAYHTVALHHPDTAALDVLAQLVGSGRSARLVQDLVEERQVAVSASAWSWTPGQAGLFGLEATYNPDEEEAVLEAIEDQIDAWREVPFTDAELRKAKRQILVSELRGLETASGQARDIGSGEFYAGDPRYSETYLGRIDAVDLDALRRVIETYLRPDGRTLVILSPNLPETVVETAGGTAREETSLERLTLANGIPLIVREDHRLPLVYISIVGQGGLLSEHDDTVGVSQLMSEMLTRGTPTRDSQQIATEVESMGAALSAFSGRNSFGLNGMCLSDDMESFAGLVADCLLHPTFPADELEKQREIQLAAIRRQREQPMSVAREQIQAMLFPEHPYQWSTLGTEESVNALSREDLAAHAERLLVSSNIVLAVFGDIGAAKAKALFERLFAALPAGPRAEITGIPPQPRLPNRVIQHQPKQQAIVIVGFPGVNVYDPRIDALSILQTALSGLSSDLVIEIRDKRGLAYFAGAWSIAGLEPGYIGFYAGTRPEEVEAVEALIQEQITRVTTGGLREEEWKRAKAQMIADSDKVMQANGRFAQMCALNELYGLGYDYTFSLRQRLNAIGADAIRDAAAGLLLEEAKGTSIVLPMETESPSDAP
jgi:zinc protease